MFNWKEYEEIYKLEKEKAFKWLHGEYAKLKAGVANPNILDSVRVHAYGEMMQINQVANISLPDPRSLVIKPYDKSIIKDIAAGINAANLGLNPQVDADLIRIVFPTPTEDSRKELAKKAKSISEELKVKIRLIRQDLQDKFKKEEGVLEDDKKHFQNELDNLTKKINQEIDQLYNDKQKEIMKI